MTRVCQEWGSEGNWFEPGSLNARLSPASGCFLCLLWPHCLWVSDSYLYNVENIHKIKRQPIKREKVSAKPYTVLNYRLSWRPDKITYVKCPALRAFGVWFENLEGMIFGGEAQDSIHGLSQQGHEGRQGMAIAFKLNSPHLPIKLSLTWTTRGTLSCFNLLLNCQRFLPAFRLTFSLPISFH